MFSAIRISARAVLATAFIFTGASSCQAPTVDEQVSALAVAAEHVHTVVAYTGMAPVNRPADLRLLTTDAVAPQVLSDLAARLAVPLSAREDAIRCEPSRCVPVDGARALIRFSAIDLGASSGEVVMETTVFEEADRHYRQVDRIFLTHAGEVGWKIDRVQTISET